MDYNFKHLMENIQHITHYISNYGDNKTKYSLVSALKIMNSKLDKIYLNMLSKEMNDSNRSLMQNMVLFAVVYMLFYELESSIH